MSSSYQGVPFVCDVGTNEIAAHPRLEGADLAVFGVEIGHREGTYLYDPENPEAWLAGESVEVGFDGSE